MINNKQEPRVGGEKIPDLEARAAVLRARLALAHDREALVAHMHERGHHNEARFPDPARWAKDLKRIDEMLAIAAADAERKANACQ